MSDRREDLETLAMETTVDALLQAADDLRRAEDYFDDDPRRGQQHAQAAVLTAVANAIAEDGTLDRHLRIALRRSGVNLTPLTPDPIKLAEYAGD